MKHRWGYLITKVTAIGEIQTPISVFKRIFEDHSQEKQNFVECDENLGIVASKELVTGLCGGISIENRQF